MYVGREGRKYNHDKELRMPGTRGHYGVGFAVYHAMELTKN